MATDSGACNRDSRSFYLLGTDDNEMLAETINRLVLYFINALKEQDGKINRLEILIHPLKFQNK